MKSSFYHVKLNVGDLGFYKDLLSYLGFKMYAEFGQGFGVTDGDVTIWVFKTDEKHSVDFDYQATGLNHLAWRVESKEDVDKFYKEFLLANNASVLFEPAEHPQYNQGKGYYAVFFEDPDHIKLEVVWKA